MNYSQNNEQEIILKYFGKFIGTFCDIGANDGKTFSNTAALADKGWGGVLVEPSDRGYNSLLERYKNNKNITLLKCAVTDKHEKRMMDIGSDSLLSTFIPETKKQWEKIVTFTPTEIDCITFSELPNQPYDFISIDAEGMDWIILQQIDLSNTKMICIEYGKRRDLIASYCVRYGMHPISFNAENLIMAK